MIRRFVLRHVAIVLGITLLAVMASQPSSVHGATAGALPDPAPDARTRMVPWLRQYYHLHGAWDGVETAVELAGTLLEAPVLLVDRQGHVVAGAGSGLPALAPMTTWAYPIQDADGEVLATLYLPDAPVRAPGPAVPALWGGVVPLLLLALGMGGATLGLGVAGLWSLRGTLQMLRAAALRLGQGDLGSRVVRAGRDEGAALGAAFNTMADGLAALEGRRRALLATVAHDLRTPLTVLHGYLEGLQGGRIADRRAAEQAFAAMAEEVAYLTTLVGVLQAPPAPAGRKAPCIDVAALIAAVVRRLQPLAAARRITLTAALPARLPPLPADGASMHRLLANLLENSLRYTPAGGTIRVRAALAPPAPGGPHLVIQVEDSGVGMAPDHLPQLVVQGGGAGDGAPPGDGSRRGLGLAIVGAIVAAQRGTLGVASQRGVGTVVTVRLPVRYPGLKHLGLCLSPKAGHQRPSDRRPDCGY